MTDTYDKISVIKELPKQEGKYIVFTKTMMNSNNIFECSMHIDNKGKVKWSCINQIVTHWLKLKS